MPPSALSVDWRRRWEPDEALSGCRFVSVQQIELPSAPVACTPTRLALERAGHGRSTISDCRRSNHGQVDHSERVADRRHRCSCGPRSGLRINESAPATLQVGFGDISVAPGIPVRSSVEASNRRRRLRLSRDRCIEWPGYRQAEPDLRRHFPLRGDTRHFALDRSALPVCQPSRHRARWAEHGSCPKKETHHDE